MKVTEFRIGNYFLYREKVVLKIKVGDLYYLDKKIYLDNYKPLSITEQWKDKLKDSPLYIDKVGFVIFKNGYNYSFIWEDYPFLHQLQNLYFAVAGEELIFNN